MGQGDLFERLISFEIVKKYDILYLCLVIENIKIDYL